MRGLGRSHGTRTGLCFQRKNNFPSPDGFVTRMALSRSQRYYVQYVSRRAARPGEGGGGSCQMPEHGEDERARHEIFIAQCLYFTSIPLFPRYSSTGPSAPENLYHGYFGAGSAIVDNIVPSQGFFGLGNRNRMQL